MDIKISALDGEAELENNETETQSTLSLLETVNTSSQHVRNFFISFLMVELYMAVIIWATTEVTRNK